MTSKKSPMDKAFIEKQHLLLTKLHAQLQAATRGQEAEETGIHADSAGEAHEAELAGEGQQLIAAGLLGEA